MIDLLVDPDMWITLLGFLSWYLAYLTMKRRSKYWEELCMKEEVIFEFVTTIWLNKIEVVIYRPVDKKDIRLGLRLSEFLNTFEPVSNKKDNVLWKLKH